MRPEVPPRRALHGRRTPLADGDIVLLYSDGLVERRDTDPDEDTARLLAAAEQLLRTHPALHGHTALQAYADELIAQLDGPHRSAT